MYEYKQNTIQSISESPGISAEIDNSTEKTTTQRDTPPVIQQEPRSISQSITQVNPVEEAQHVSQPILLTSTSTTEQSATAPITQTVTQPTIQIEGSQQPQQISNQQPPKPQSGAPPTPSPPAPSSQNEIKTDKEFSYTGFQVVRGAFFAHLFEPSVTFKSEKVYVNAACIRKLPTVDFVQFLVHPDKKILAVRPCSEDTQDSFRWCSSAPTISKRKAKAITCKIFFHKVMSLMKWNPDYRYKIIGKLVCTPSDKIFVFDLTNAEAFRKKTADDTTSTSNSPLYPDSWMDSFGIPVDDHHNDFNLNIFDEDAVFTMKREPEKSPESPNPQPTQNNPGNNIEKEVQS